jgi:hypothetical protein
MPIARIRRPGLTGLKESLIEIIDIMPPYWLIAITDSSPISRAATVIRPKPLNRLLAADPKACTGVAFGPALAAALLRAGLPAARVMGYIAMIDYIVLGSTVDDFTRGFADQAATYAEMYPSLARALDQTDREVINDDAFETSLRLILSELGTELSRSEPDPLDTDDSGEAYLPA